MSDFETRKVTPLPSQADPAKHVRYSLGMVLGVDDFIQEFAYLSNRDQWLARDLIGYGTVRGLQVEMEEDGTNGPRVTVKPGVALTPRGELVCVSREQCASLNKWLGTQLDKDDTRRQLESKLIPPGSPPSAVSLQLYVTLCYGVCPTDDQLIPGEPCRDESEAMEASRWTDNFELKLSLDPPDQTEEDAIRDFVDWLRQIEITDDLIASTPLDQFLHAVREAGHLISSPPASPPGSPPEDFMFGSPPTGLHIQAGDTCEYWRAAFRLWVTELRPKWTVPLERCAAPPTEGCLLLAELSMALTSDHRQVVGNKDDVEVNEEHRPYVLPLRLLQEWLLCGQKAIITAPPASPPASGSGPNPASIVKEEISFGIDPNPGTSLEYARSNHTHGTPPDPIPPHVADLDVHQAHLVGGDVKGTLGQTTVESILKRPVMIPASAQSGNVLTFRDTQWSVEPGPFVQHPPGLPDYFIVAAGIVSGDGTAQGLVYNDLNAFVQDPLFIVTFKGYQRPDPAAPKFNYIVKALPLSSKPPTTPMLLVNFVDFLDQDQGIALAVSEMNGQLLTGDELKQVTLMLEVSCFPILPS